MAALDSNTIIKFANDMAVAGLISDDDETAYREEVRDLAVWCQDNNLAPSRQQDKKLNVDYRIWRAEHTPIQLSWAVVEQVELFKLLGVHITKDRSWPKYTNTFVKRVRQHLFPLRRLKRFGMGPQNLKRFYS